MSLTQKLLKQYQSIVILLIIIINKIKESSVHFLIINLSSKGHVKQSATDAFKTASKRVIHKTAEATGDLIGNKITDKITRVSKTSLQNNLDANEEEIPKERYISLQKKDRKLLMI